MIEAAIIEADVERDRKMFIALDAKVTNANRELAECILRSRHSLQQIADWLNCSRSRVFYLKKWAKGGFRGTLHDLAVQRVERYEAPEIITVEDELEPTEYREAFLLRAADALSFAVYSGRVDGEVIAAARRVVAKWKSFTQTLEASYGKKA